MKDIFPGFYGLTDEEFDSLWQDCLFVLDANVLLYLYRAPQSLSNDLLGVLRQVSDRLWIPYQAALEYQMNRLEVISTQRKTFKSVQDILKKIDVDKELDKLQLNKRHSTIDPQPFLKDLQSAIDSFSNRLEELLEEQAEVDSEDKIRQQLDEILAGKVGPKEEQKWFEDLYKEGEKRYEAKMPPGYRDASKTVIYQYAGLTIKNKFGDLIAWKQTIKHAGENNIKKIIFVTDDAKEDWWLEVNGKTIGPRPELVEEIKREGKVELFYMYPVNVFLQRAADYLQVAVNPESIAQAEDIASANSETSVTEGSAVVYSGSSASAQGIAFPGRALKYDEMTVMQFLPALGILSKPLDYEVARDDIALALGYERNEVIAILGPLINENYLDISLAKTRKGEKYFALTLGPFGKLFYEQNKWLFSAQT